MKKVRLNDKTLKQDGKLQSLSFREKIELCKLIDRLSPDCIELPPIRQKKADSLLLKSIASAVKNSHVAVAVLLNRQSVTDTWNALKEAVNPRLQIAAPVSSVQMEYLYHLKPEAMQGKITELIRECRACTEEVEFIAEDFSRADRDFVIAICKSATEAGAKYVTFRDMAGEMLPDEMVRMIADLTKEIGENAMYGVDCHDAMSMADACALEAIRGGITEIKAAAFRLDCVSLQNMVKVLFRKGHELDAECYVRREEIRRITGQIDNICSGSGNALRYAEQAGSQESPETVLNIHDSKESIFKAVADLGYELSSEDREKVYQGFLNVAGKKETATMRELEAIIAAEAMQVPSVVSVDSYMINIGNAMGAMAHMKLLIHNEAMEGIAVGDGPIDAAFMAIEQATGRHFELDDFQIRSMTSGRDSSGETLIRLRSEGKVYSGRGISNDIVGASIQSYINALNKIIYEEDEA